MKHLNITLFIAATSLLTACSGGGGNPAAPAVRASLLSSYTETLATGNKSLLNTNPEGMAASLNGTLQGKYTIQRGLAETDITVNGHKYSFFGSSEKTSDTSTIRIKEAGTKYAAIGGIASRSENDVAFTVRGVETPISNLPTSKTNYNGSFSVLSVKNGQDLSQIVVNGGDFQGVADFGPAQSVTGTLTAGGQTVGVLDANISGNSISGKTTIDTVETGQGEIATEGNFYGPNAEAMAALGSGEVGNYKVLGIITADKQ